MDDTQLDPALGVPEIPPDDFSRRASMRGGNLMWLLGAGASAAAGIPTAGDMIWEFKQRLFVSQRHASAEMVADLASANVRQRLQDHIDSMANLPRSGSPDEYSDLFEAVYPSESDRQKYLDAKITGARPSYGHLALATLMRANRARLLWTTNFDPLVADACAKAYDGTGALTSVDLSAPALARQAIASGRWPIEIKLHGDFRSRRLKNTSDELRHQDGELREALVECCGRHGLIVVGYSGRDDSIMATLETAIAVPKSFPEGLFWLHRGEDSPDERVIKLLTRARDAGVECAMVRIQNFDEAMRDIVRLVPDLNTKLLDEFGKQRARWTAAPAISGKAGWPVVRFNALPLSQVPTVCRRIVCDVGGYADAQRAVADAAVQMLVARTRRGVLCFGSDAAARAAFKDFGITEFDLDPIEVRRLRYESSERGLLRDALSRALGRERGMTIVHRRRADLLYPTDLNGAPLEALGRLVGKTSGVLKDFVDIRWHEGVSIRLEWAADQLWLVFDPTTVFSELTEEARAAAADFGRERTVARYNRQLDRLIDFWAGFLGGDGQPLRSLNITDGVDAVFELGTRTGFSRRAVA